MAAKDRVRWDSYYREATGPLPKPDPLLLQFTPEVTPEAPRRALDLAGGLGQNGIWLASQGYTADIMDISRVALARARSEVASRNLRNVNILQVDLDDFELEPATYDLLCIFRYLKRPIMPTVKASIVPGGRVLYETFNINYLEIVPGFNVDFLLDMGELLRMFDGWTVLHHDENEHISQIVAVNQPPPEPEDDDDDKFQW